MSKVTRILDPEPVERLADYVSDGGGEALAVAARVDPETLIETVTDAGLRGRGGAGFPTGRKMATIARARKGTSIPVVVNAAEGEPGTFKDRMLLRRNPFRVLEGACIAARAVGADSVVVAIKASFTHEIERLTAAIDEVTTAGWTDGLTVSVVTGPGEYLFGEETAMLEVIDGQPPFPRVVAPYRRGVKPDAHSARPQRDSLVALVDNVETLANVPCIVLNGADWFRSVGTDDSPGTIVCTVTGDTERAGVGEYAMGTPLREVLDELGGGPEAGTTVTAVLGGVSSPPLDGSMLDTPLTYEDIAAAGAGLGSAGFIVVGSETPIRAVAAGVARFLATESCGQCEPCKRDGLAITESLSTTGDRAAIDDALSTVSRGARCALAGQTERVVGGLLQLADSLGEPNGPVEPYPIVPMVDLVDDKAVLDTSHLDKRPDWTKVGDEPNSNQWPVERLADRPTEVTAVHVTEVDEKVGTVPDQPDIDMFGPVRELHAALEQQVARVRTASPDRVHAELGELRDQLERHRRVSERLLYPLLERLEPEIGADVAWYPEQREEHAARLAERLDLGAMPVTPHLLDDLCADIHVSVIELDARVLPLLAEHLADDADEVRLIAGDIVEEINDEP
jgi:NADH:ubiquinone oxidoreductase subunit F (NADH-binding)